MPPGGQNSRAVDNCREYVAVHHRLGVDTGDRLLDVACGSGLAIGLARLRGACCCGIDASARLVAVARHRNRTAISGSAICMPCRGIRRRSTSSPASAESGERHLARLPSTPGPSPRRTRRDNGVGPPEGVCWSLGAAPFGLAAAEKASHQAEMVSPGRPGAGEQLLESDAFAGIERVDVPFVWEFADP